METELVPATSRKRSYHALDGLRGVAALCVVCWHSIAFLAPLAIGSGYLAVDLFFLMSGFVIAHAYQHRLGHSLGPVDFAILRFIRLYPLYIAGTLLGLIVVLIPLARHGPAPGDWAAILATTVPALLMLPGPGLTSPSLLYSLNFPAWSLFCELIANVLYGWVAPWRQRWLFPAVVICAGVGLVITAVQLGSLDGGWQWRGAWIGPVRVAFSFVLGVIMYKFHAAERLPVVKFPPPLLLVVVAAVLYVKPDAQYHAAYDLAAVLVVFPAVVWLCVVNEPRRGLRFYTVTGLVSYPLYTIHGPFILLVELAGHHVEGYDRFNAHAAALAPWSGLALLAVLLPLSWLLAVSYDIRARALLSRAARHLPRVRGRAAAWNGAVKL